MSGPVVVLDTGILVGAKDPHATEHVECARSLDLAHEHRFVPLLSAITVAGVCVGYRLEDDERGRQVFLDYVRSADVFGLRPVDLEVAEAAGQVRAQFGLRLPDAILVATGLLGSADFVATHDFAFGRSNGALAPISAGALIAKLR